MALQMLSSARTEQWSFIGGRSRIYAISCFFIFLASSIVRPLSISTNNEDDAMIYIIKWWEKSEEREESNKLMSRAIMSCQKIDIESGILTGNRDGLD